MTNSDSDAESEASESVNSSSKYNDADEDEQKSSRGSESSKVDLKEVVVRETKTDDRFETVHNPWLVDPVEKLSKRTKYSRCWKYVQSIFIFFYMIFPSALLSSSPSFSTKFHEDISNSTI